MRDDYTMTEEHTMTDGRMIDIDVRAFAARYGLGLYGRDGADPMQSYEEGPHVYQERIEAVLREHGAAGMSLVLSHYARALASSRRACAAYSAQYHALRQEDQA